ncbi:MAG: ATPase domain-containing protein, partial [Pseudomonadota bacterium]
MAKQTTTFTCSNCGATHKKWAGQCSSCGSWNTISEEVTLSTGPRSTSGGRQIELGDLATTDAPLTRRKSGIAELNRVLGGGLVPASAILVGGDPGIGKSTLLLQAAADFAKGGAQVTYITGEEAAAQVRMRAARLGLSDAPLQLAAETNLRDILTTLDKTRPQLAVIDSIQTM